MIALLLGLVALVSPAQDERWYLTEEEVELVDLLDTCSKGLGIALDYDRALVQGRVTIRSEGGYTSDGLWALANRLLAAKKLAVGVDILRAMFRDPKCVTFLSFPAALVATGVRGVLRTLVQRKLVDVVITTCGTADHDLARTWKDYYHGDFEMDDVELHRLGVNRLGNVLVPNESYGIVLERKLQPWLRQMHQKK